MVEKDIQIKVPKNIVTLEGDQIIWILTKIFMGVQPSLNHIICWMFEHLCTKKQVELVALPREFMLFYFGFEEDMKKVLEYFPWFLGRKGLILKKWEKGF